jgi:hypothetical protein
MLGMRVRSSGDPQLYNVEKLLDTLPAVASNASSMFGLISACEQGYGKKSTVEKFRRHNFKLIVIANSMGSEHTIVGTSVVKECIQKNLLKSHDLNRNCRGQ